MKARTKVKTKKTVILELSVDEAQYIHALTVVPAAVVEAAGWDSKEEGWDEAMKVVTKLNGYLDDELF